MATPAIVEGRKRWGLRLRIGGGYLYVATGTALPRLCAPRKQKIKGTLAVPTAPAAPANGVAPAVAGGPAIAPAAPAAGGGGAVNGAAHS